MNYGDLFMLTPDEAATLERVQTNPDWAVVHWKAWDRGNHDPAFPDKAYTYYIYPSDLDTMDSVKERGYNTTSSESFSDFDEGRFLWDVMIGAHEQGETDAVSMQLVERVHMCMCEAGWPEVRIGVARFGDSRIPRFTGAEHCPDKTVWTALVMAGWPYMDCWACTVRQIKASTRRQPERDLINPCTHKPVAIWLT